MPRLVRKRVDANVHGLNRSCRVHFTISLYNIAFSSVSNYRFGCIPSCTTASFCSGSIDSFSHHHSASDCPDKT